MKKLLFLIITISIVILIYTNNIDNKIYYLSIGDFVNEHATYNDKIISYLKNKDLYENSIVISDTSYRTTDIINIITNNEEFNDTKIQNALIKADYVLISIGQNDIINMTKVDEKLILDISSDIEKLYKSLRKYCKEKIIFLGIFNSNNCDNQNNNELQNLNQYLKRLSFRYNIEYIDIFEDMIKYDYKNCSIPYPTSQGYDYIYSKILPLFE